MQIQQVGIVGRGDLATMLAQKVMDSDIKVTLVESMDEIPRNTNLSELKECQIVIEATLDDVPHKIKLLRQIEDIVLPDTPLAAAVSSLSVTELAANLQKPDRLVGLHFFMQADRRKLVEVVRSLQCSNESYLQAYELMKAIGQVPIRCKDVPGYLVQRLFVPYINLAIQSYGDGLATKEDLDVAVELGLGYPMGPLKLTDEIGLDAYLSMAEPLLNQLHDTKFAPPPLVKSMVKAGYLGEKSGKGFYEHGDLGESKD